MKPNNYPIVWCKRKSPIKRPDYGFQIMKSNNYLIILFPSNQCHKMISLFGFSTNEIIETIPLFGFGIIGIIK